MKLNKIGEVWNSTNRLLSGFNSLLSSKNFATMATWRNDFSFLLLTQEPTTQDEQLPRLSSGYPINYAYFD